MDTSYDFAFLVRRVADKFNPYQEGEYIVIQTRSKSIRRIALHRGFDYRAAKQFCELENLGSDYNHYSVRIINQGKLHHVNYDGAVGKLSKEQDWKIAEEYYNARYVEDLDCEIEICDCSYPIFWNHKSITTLTGESVTDWLPVTCLIDDNGRDISCCPNCGAEFFEDDDYVEEEFDEEENMYIDTPEYCLGCSYFHGKRFVCAVHPEGIEESICKDWEKKLG
ncbi:hypothetical protein NIES4071_108490 (plasmid) [Calothrix sp. NIES-4071]|nr:hypothetical protein NIES4071_108490 [Calothrix sp. NIES-4071]BAZ65139.1 hypothetical protein NIES4105_108720 [Calothrix sp. NIES-4105]